MDVLNRFFAVFHCGSLRGHTFCVNRKYAKNHKRGGDCVFPAPFETPPLNRPRETIAMVSLGFLPRMAKLRLTSAVFVPSYFSQKSLPVMLNTAPTPGGSRRGIAIPLLSLRVRVHRERGSRNTLSLCGSLVTFCPHRKSPKSIPQSDAAAMPLRTPCVRSTAFRISPPATKHNRTQQNLLSAVDCKSPRLVA